MLTDQNDREDDRRYVSLRRNSHGCEARGLMKLLAFLHGISIITYFIYFSPSYLCVFLNLRGETVGGREYIGIRVRGSVVIHADVNQ